MNYACFELHFFLAYMVCHLLLGLCLSKIQLHGQYSNSRFLGYGDVICFFLHTAGNVNQVVERLIPRSWISLI